MESLVEFSNFVTKHLPPNFEASSLLSEFEDYHKVIGIQIKKKPKFLFSKRRLVAEIIGNNCYILYDKACLSIFENIAEKFQKETGKEVSFVRTKGPFYGR